MAVYIIEHLEPELWNWCLIEYKRISKIVGRKNLWITNIKNPKDGKKLKKYGKIITESVKSLDLKNACLLDPESSKLLSPKECRKCNYFIFGGILGDYPPRKRTKEELTKFIKAKSYNIGKEQFSTDNAIAVVKEIEKGKSFKELKFQDKIEIKINKIESIILPYLYLKKKNKPFISPEIISYLKKKKGF